MVREVTVAVTMLTALVAAGCSSSGSGVSGGCNTKCQPPAPPTQSTPAGIEVPDYATAQDAADDACAKFQTLMGHFFSEPPREQVARLLHDAALVDDAAAAADNLGAGYSGLRAAADALLAYVAQPDFATQGNVDGAPVNRMDNQCS